MTTEDNLKIMNVYSPSYDPYDGYGRMALELVYHLDKSGVYVNAQGGPGTQLVWDTQAPVMQELVQKPIRLAFGGLMLGYPTLYERLGGMANNGLRIAVTMFESTKLPDGWVQILNECDAVVVPAKWLVKAFKNCGVYKPIHVVPLGISETFFVADQREHYRKYTRLNPFTYLCWGDRGSRKGWDLAMKAFHMAFGDRDDVRLILKSRDGLSFPYEISNANIEILRADLDEFGLRDLYLRCDAMIFPSHGEGFGLPPREFAATGGAAIVTRWWADEIEQWGYPVNYKMGKAWKDHPEHEGLGKWADVDMDHLVKQIKHVFNQKQRIIRHMGQRSATHVAKLYRWEKFAGRLNEIWNETAERVEKKKRRKGKRK